MIATGQSFFNALRQCACEAMGEEYSVNDIKIPLRLIQIPDAPDLCCRITENKMIPHEKIKSPKLSIDNREISVFNTIAVLNNYVNFHFGDEVLSAIACELKCHMAVGKMAENFSIPNSAEYAHARLVAYERCHRTLPLSDKHHKSMVLALATVEEPNLIKCKRLFNIIVALICDALCNAEPFDSDCAAFLAAFINEFLISFGEKNEN